MDKHRFLITFTSSKNLLTWTSWDPANFKKAALIWAAKPLVIMVWPTTGGPCIKTPLGSLILRFLNLSLWTIGKTRASRSSSICFSRPPISVNSSVFYQLPSLNSRVIFARNLLKNEETILIYTDHIRSTRPGIGKKIVYFEDLIKECSNYRPVWWSFWRHKTFSALNRTSRNIFSISLVRFDVQDLDKIVEEG